MYRTCDYKIVKRTVIDANCEKEIKTKEDAVKQIDSAIQKMRQLIADYEEEFKFIQEVSSKFAYILISNSNTVSEINSQAFKWFIYYQPAHWNIPSQQNQWSIALLTTYARTRPH